MGRVIPRIRCLGGGALRPWGLGCAGGIHSRIPTNWVFAAGSKRVGAASRPDFRNTKRPPAVAGSRQKPRAGRPHGWFPISMAVVPGPGILPWWIADGGKGYFPGGPYGQRPGRNGARDSGRDKRKDSTLIAG